MKIKVSDYIADFLYAQDVSYVFEMAGGMIAHLLDSLYQRQKINIVSMHHEQAAAFAVDACGRITGRVGVALATSGPGATNLLTGIGSCYFDSSPALFITGQVNTHEQKQQKNIRQLGFQETDIVAMALPITKKCYRIESASEVVGVLHEAYQIAISDRPGPVLIDIPMNIQREMIDAAKPAKILNNTKYQRLKSESDIFQLEALISALRKAERPLILAGGGINAARAKEHFLQFAETLNVPVVTSLLGLDTIAFNHPLRAGFIGSYGNRWANIALGEADCLIVLGSRLDIRQTGADTASFSKDKIIFHVDCEEAEINNRVENCMPIITHLEIFFNVANEKLASYKAPEYKDWQEKIAHLKHEWPDTHELTNIKGINPNKFFHLLSDVSSVAAGYVVDVGAHQMWAAQSLELLKQQFFLTSGGMGAMGFSLPAAIGASLSCSKQPVVVIIGDGCLQVNIQELQTVIRNKISIKIVVLNNQSLGMITQFQDSYFEGRYQSTYWGYDTPDFSAVGLAYGFKTKKIHTEDEVVNALTWLWSDRMQPMLLEVMIQPHLPVYPKIAFGRPISDMEPFVKPVDMEGT